MTHSEGSDFTSAETKYRIGFIGMGAMGSAMARGIIGAKRLSGDSVFAFAPNQEKLRKNAEEIGFTPCASLKELAGKADILVVACKPYQIRGALDGALKEVKTKALVSVAAGWLHKDYEGLLGGGARVQCVMPNTPCAIGLGVLLFEEKNTLRADELSFVKNVFGALGLIETLPSHLMAAGGAVTGCGPAFIDIIIEAYADAAVKYGIPRAAAYALVSQTVVGAAALQRSTGKHPGVLKDEVCSPGGTTIRGVAALEEHGIRDACIKSIDAVMGKLS